MNERSSEDGLEEISGLVFMLLLVPFFGIKLLTRNDDEAELLTGSSKLRIACDDRRAMTFFRDVDKEALVLLTSNEKQVSIIWDGIEDKGLIHVGFVVSPSKEIFPSLTSVVNRKTRRTIRQE